jgi:hypothetical protein
METKVLVFTILLMNSLGMKITPRKVLRFLKKTTASSWETVNPELLDALVLLWNAAAPRIRPAQAKLCGARGKSGNDFLSGPIGRKLQPANRPVQGAEGVPTAVVLRPDNQASPLADDKLDNHPDGLPAALPGRYIYGIGRGTKGELGGISGVDNAPVYGIQYQEVTALVHACRCQPYQSESRETALAWVKQHQTVLDEAADYFNCIIPMGFDIIIDGSAAAAPDAIVRDWLAARYEQIMRLFQKLTGKMEYGIRVTIAKEKLLSLARESNSQISAIEEKIATMSKGTAFLFQNELSGAIRETQDRLREAIRQDLQTRLAPHIAAFKEENVRGGRQAEDHELVAALTILTESNTVGSIGEILEEFQNQNGASVEFTGPWPPYSFVEALD